MEYSVFSCGSTNTCIALAELMKGLGHSATLINLGSNEWWDDCMQLKKIFPGINLKDISGEQFDLVFEVGHYTLSKADRASLAKKAIWILRKPAVLSEIELSINPTYVNTRCVEGIEETWLLNDVTMPDDVTAVETLTRRPVRILPFIWTPILAEVHYRSINSPTWSGDSKNKIIVHMVDTNTTSSSSSTIPLVIMRNCAKHKLPIQTWRLHNGELISKSKFFQDNVVKHCSDLDLSGECVGRQRCIEWTLHPNNIALVHLRFRALRPVLLDLAWVGIPVVHNSPALYKIGNGLQKFYYHNNSIQEGTLAVEEVIKMIHTDLSGWTETLKARREQILRKWSPISPQIKIEWDFYLKQVGITGIVEPKALPVVKKAVESEVTILFTDMWEGFQADYNFFLLLLNNAGKAFSNPITVKGYSVDTIGARVPELIIFGPFGNRWKEYPSIPKVHFTGENTPEVIGENVKLNLGFEHRYMCGKNYLRFPLWLTEINWFKADINRLVNPLPIPLELCTRVANNPRTKFCSFIVTNPTNPIRNQSYHWLNSYKNVDSAGRLYNTVGPELFALGGGGGGELKKTKFMMDYKFALTYENNSGSGYTTEKYLHAKAAGTVPIYWGDPEFHRDFDIEGCIDARHVRTPEELIDLVKACESDEEWNKRASKPALDSYRVELARRTLAECAKRVYEILGLDVSCIPDSIGAQANSEDASYGMEYFLQKEDKPLTVSEPALQVPLLVTFVTFKFLGSLQQWLGSAAIQLNAFPDMKALVFVGDDVGVETISMLKEKYSFADFESVPTDWAPPDFPDFWEPTHYAWKIWIYHTLVNRETLANKLILYMDAGALLVRWPTAWMQTASKHGIACLEDPREENDRWCGDAFCESLSVTDEERSKKQIVAGIMCFIGGHPVPTKFFNDAFVYAQKRDVIVGPRLSGVSADGKSYGHRHDQSILSILVYRQAIPLVPLDTVYCDYSMRRTFQSGRAIYVHRGNFQKSIPFLPGIEDAFVINLDRRKDRMDKFWETHPELENRVNRQPAYDGLSMELTEEMKSLFKPNDFFWKKAVTGCAMSHLNLWWKLVNEHPDIHNYLIFEDDAKLEPDWESTLGASMAHVPEDYDVLYLGGILPPNRPGFNSLLEPVTKYYSRIKKNQVFGQQEPTRYFHSCAYAYILSRKGALKIMKNIEEKGGYWTSADHMLCSPCDTMNLYFLTPVVAKCFQDSDPAYANSEFNNFSRIDKFDSDLWNNDERFSVSLNAVKDIEDVRGTLRTIFNGSKPTVTHPAPAPAPAPAPVSTNNTYTGPTLIDSNTRGMPIRFMRYVDNKLDFTTLFEGSWLFYLFGNIKTASIDVIDESVLPTDCPIIILQRPYVPVLTRILENWDSQGVEFKILHVSDEVDTLVAARDPLDVYALKGCKSVLRFYIRNDFPKGTESKIQVIPLGYRWSSLKYDQTPSASTPHLPFRDIHWSFYGTNWCNRKESMKPLLDSKLIGSYAFYDDWLHPDNLSKDEYLKKMLSSIFVPCPDGVNAETFRVYEALDAGCIPIVLHSERNDMWFRWISSHVPILDINSWDNALRNMYQLLSKPATLEIYRNEVITAWVNWKNTLRTQTTTWLLS
jgi:GR25 family glycosyltransferase involved in LPS biosynthesis